MRTDEPARPPDPENKPSITKEKHEPATSTFPCRPTPGIASGAGLDVGCFRPGWGSTGGLPVQTLAQKLMAGLRFKSQNHYWPARYDRPAA
jgi:hypothetical protein